jgi:hypothetical protein
MVLKNPRHERFANFVAQGKTQYEAYELCGYKPSNGNPCKLASNPVVAQRIKEILEKTAAAQQISAETLINDANRVFVRAMEIDQLSAANGAIKEKGILTGHRIERREVGTPGDFDAIGDAELEQMLAERIAQLDLTDVGETQAERMADLGIVPETDTQH